MEPIDHIEFYYPSRYMTERNAPIIRERRRKILEMVLNSLAIALAIYAFVVFGYRAHMHELNSLPYDTLTPFLKFMGASLVAGTGIAGDVSRLVVNFFA